MQKILGLTNVDDFRFHFTNTLKVISLAYTVTYVLNQFQENYTKIFLCYMEGGFTGCTEETGILETFTSQGRSMPHHGCRAHSIPQMPSQIEMYDCNALSDLIKEIEC